MDVGQLLSLQRVPRDFGTIIEDINASRYLTYATFCLLVYDHALTFSDEVQLVWRSRSVNLVKVLFLCNRYLVPACIAVDVALLSGLVSGLASSTCHGWLIFYLVAEVITLFSTTYIITLRIRALWTDNREVNILLQSVWVVHVLGTTALVANSVVKNQSSYSAFPWLDICFGTITDTWTVWLPAMVFHFVMFLLLILRAVSTPRKEHTKLMAILLLDGFVYFAVVFCAFLANMVIWALASPALAQLPHDPVWAISTLAITRLLISLQKRYHGEGENPQLDPRLAATGVPPPIPSLQYRYDVETSTTRSSSHEQLAKLRSMADKGLPAIPSGSLRIRMRTAMSSTGIHFGSNSRRFDKVRSIEYEGGARSLRRSITTQPHSSNLELRAVPNSRHRLVSNCELGQAPSSDAAPLRRSRSLAAAGGILAASRSPPHPYVEAARMAGIPVPSAQMLHDSAHFRQGSLDRPPALYDPFYAYYHMLPDNTRRSGSSRTRRRSDTSRTSVRSTPNSGNREPVGVIELGLSRVRAVSLGDGEASSLSNSAESSASRHARRAKRTSKPLPALPSLTTACQLD